ncbi:Protein tssc1 [Coemansia spiralis]|uniref:Protein tssc1 n=2 Tax=Coemansia TaxID=4863 RepID=A0A9W8GAY0_9FUNG|nr:Protein tssc1 [Coemansia umbellata]KAJ2624630.1 Protein tssc1 [Coemansia sp. RSA 1358]KAJ2679783.1 Protein tssc1 [Coemansia spiralis]
MDADRPTSYVYGIERHTLCLAAMTGDTQSNRFALGTLGITEPSEIHLVDFKSDEGELQSQVYKHHSGIRALASVPQDPLQLVVVNADHSVELVELTADETRQLAPITPMGPEPHSVACHSSNPVAAVASSAVGVWDLAQSTMQCTLPTTNAAAVAWHPNDPRQLATADGASVRTWDTRTRQPLLTIHHAHTKARSLAFNPVVPYMLASGGNMVRIWDMRSPSSALLEIDNHSHWVLGIEFNPSHDQLLLSAGSDGLVNLESVVSASSAQLVAGGALDTDSDTQSCEAVDGLVAQFDDHETSVYAAHWSVADPWIFASLSFDGRLVINTVPREEKYKILL